MMPRSIESITFDAHPDLTLKGKNPIENHYMQRRDPHLPCAGDPICNTVNNLAANKPPMVNQSNQSGQGCLSKNSSLMASPAQIAHPLPQSSGVVHFDACGRVGHMASSCLQRDQGQHGVWVPKSRQSSVDTHSTPAPLSLPTLSALHTPPPPPPLSDFGLYKTLKIRT